MALLVAMSILWVFGGRQLSLFLDRFGTVELVSAPIKSISYEGNGRGGILHVNDLALSLNSLGPVLRSLEIGTTKDDQVALSFGGHVFSFGARRAAQSDELATAPPLGDDASIAMRRSAISWPTPLDSISRLAIRRHGSGICIINSPGKSRMAPNSICFGGTNNISIRQTVGRAAS